ncbi:hypothetical protein BJY52DRAFT_1419462 [Lactarius psammicola]|nr:hypothetical protein BJY52DRAFT_1419462 [Lactarius psammicola]
MMYLRFHTPGTDVDYARDKPHGATKTVKVDRACLEGTELLYTTPDASGLETSVPFMISSVMDKPCYEETKGNVTPFVHCAWFHVGGHTLGPGIACTSIDKDKTTKSIGEPELQLAFAPQVHAILPTVQINEGDHERPAVMTPTPDSTFEIYIPVNSLAPTIGGIGICARTSYCCHVVVQMSANILMGQIFGIRFLMFEFSEVYIPQN